jgi:hypothetical protein
MGDVGDVFKAWKSHKKERRDALGIPCPDCTKRLPKADPKILMPNQKCWCGYKDRRPREKDNEL